MTDTPPNASPYKDRHGTERWRFRRKGKTIALPGQPGDADFEAAYQAAVEGRPLPPKGDRVVAFPGAPVPRSLRAAWRLVPTNLPEWRKLEPVTQASQSKIAEKFLESEVEEGAGLKWGDVPVIDLRRRHIKMLLTSMHDRPHAARHLLVVVRRMILVALDEEWIDVDPSYKISHRPEYIGWKAWPESARKAFEDKWPLGTTPRLAYALALWLGNRRGDVANLRVDAIQGNKIYMKQGKTGRDLVLDITPMLAEVLAAADLSGPTILKTAWGDSFSVKSLTGRMADWTKSAGLAKGHTLHGLRKTLGKMLAEGGATTRQIMDTLGHTAIQHAELYTREAEQQRLARAGMKAVTRLVASRKK